MHKVDGIILSQLMFEQQDFPSSLGCCPIHATGGSLLPCGRYLLASLTGNREGSKGIRVLRVKPTPTWFPTNSPYTQMDSAPLHMYNDCFVDCKTELIVLRLSAHSTLFSEAMHSATKRHHMRALGLVHSFQLANDIHDIFSLMPDCNWSLRVSFIVSLFFVVASYALFCLLGHLLNVIG